VNNSAKYLNFSSQWLRENMNYLKYLAKKTSNKSNSFYNILYLMSATDYIKYTKVFSPSLDLVDKSLKTKTVKSITSMKASPLGLSN